MGSAEVQGAVPASGLAVAPSPTCRAPHVSMRFAPDGTVDACCANDAFPLGRIGDQTIAEIWAGAPIQALRSALDAGDFTHGCLGCGVEIETGNRATTVAAMYDRYPDGVPEWPRRLEFALSNVCNLQCVHCSGDLSSSIRAQRERRPPLVSPYDDAFFDELAPYLAHLEVAVFIGGEPFLARESRRVWDMLIERDLHPEVDVTTNATIWDERVEHYVRALRMNVAVSVDGHTAATNEAIRVGSDHAKVERIRGNLRTVVAEYGGAFAVNHCLMVQNWHELGDFLEAADRHGDRVSLIPVMGPAADSLFHQPVSVVREVVAVLEAESGDRERTLTRNRQVWLDALAQLRGHLGRLETAEVPVLLSARRVEDAASALDRAAGELETLTGRAALVVRIAHGTIVEVQREPDWAGVLAVSTWAGRRVESLLGLLAEVGRVGELDLDRSERGTLRSTLTLTIAGREVRVHSILINQHAPESTLAVSVAGELPNP